MARHHRTGRSRHRRGPRRRGLFPRAGDVVDRGERRQSVRRSRRSPVVRGRFPHRTRGSLHHRGCGDGPLRGARGRRLPPPGRIHRPRRDLRSSRRGACEQPHTDEIYLIFDVEDGEFPGDDALGVTASDGCLAAFESYVGVSYDVSELDYYYYQPTKSSWNHASDRTVQCILFSYEEVTGTLKGANY